MTGQAYLTALPTTASFTTLMTGTKAVATEWYTDTAATGAKQYAEVISYDYFIDCITLNALGNKMLTGNFNVLCWQLY